MLPPIRREHDKANETNPQPGLQSECPWRQARQIPGCLSSELPLPRLRQQRLAVQHRGRGLRQPVEPERLQIERPVEADHPHLRKDMPGPRGWLLDASDVSEVRKESRYDAAVAAWAGSVPPAACYLSSATIAEIVFGIEQVADPMFRAELESWLRDEFRAWFGARILEVDAPVLLT